VNDAHHPIHVLLVDDDPAFAELIRTVLTRGGVDVTHAYDGAEGVELALELRPDLVLMDVRMPGMDGFEATRRILERLPGTPVLVVSSSKDREDVERSYAAGAVGYLPKDRATAELLERVEELRRTTPEPRNVVSYRVSLVS
jgi:CheY-like chemotaxis protein